MKALLGWCSDAGARRQCFAAAPETDRRPEGCAALTRQSKILFGLDELIFRRPAGARRARPDAGIATDQPRKLLHAALQPIAIQGSKVGRQGQQDLSSLADHWRSRQYARHR